MTTDIPKVKDSPTEVCNEVIRLLRLQRHDFINHIQVVHGMLQLGKIDRAKAYIEEIAKDPVLVSNTMQEYKPENCVRKGRFE